MPQLLDLPEELLTLILEEVGGRELRRDSNKLVVSRKWYASAQPVYLSGLNLTKIREHGCTLANGNETFWHSANERRLMQKNSRGFQLRLRGHWWDDGTRQHYANREVDEPDETPEEANVSPFGETIVVPEYECDGQMLAWRKACNAKLRALGLGLAGFEALEDLMLQVGFDTKEAFGTPWSYVYAATLERLLLSVPLITSLNTLTLDLYAGLHKYEDEDEDEEARACSSGSNEAGASLCAPIAAIIPLVPKVRLRLKKSCAALFKIPDGLSAEEVRLKSLVVKLHMPHHNYWFTDSTVKMPSWCRGEEMQSMRHYRSMITGATEMLDTLTLLRCPSTNIAPKPPAESSNKQPTKRERKKAAKHPSQSKQPHPSGLERLRVSWPGPQGSVNIYVADVLSNRTMAPGEEFFVYEDEGQDCWDLEERGDLRDTGSLDDDLLRY